MEPWPVFLLGWPALAGDEAPAPEDVTAGKLGLLVFVLLILAVVFLGFSLVKQLRKAEAAKRAGVYGDEPETEPGEPPTDEADTEPDSA